MRADVGPRISPGHRPRSRRSRFFWVKDLAGIRAVSPDRCGTATEPRYRGPARAGPGVAVGTSLPFGRTRFNGSTGVRGSFAVRARTKSRARLPATLPLPRIRAGAHRPQGAPGRYAPPRARAVRPALTGRTGAGFAALARARPRESSPRSERFWPAFSPQLNPRQLREPSCRPARPGARVRSLRSPLRALCAGSARVGPRSPGGVVPPFSGVVPGSGVLGVSVASLPCLASSVSCRSCRWSCAPLAVGSRPGAVPPWGCPGGAPGCRCRVSSRWSAFPRPPPRTCSPVRGGAACRRAPVFAPCVGWSSARAWPGACPCRSARACRPAARVWPPWWPLAPRRSRRSPWPLRWPLFPSPRPVAGRFFLRGVPCLLSLPLSLPVLRRSRPLPFPPLVRPGRLAPAGAGCSRVRVASPVAPAPAASPASRAILARAWCWRGRPARPGRCWCWRSPVSCRLAPAGAWSLRWPCSSGSRPAWRPAARPGRPGRAAPACCWWPVPRAWPPSIAAAAPRGSAWPRLARFPFRARAGWWRSPLPARPRRFRSRGGSAPVPPFWPRRSRSPAFRFPFRRSAVSPVLHRLSRPPFLSARASFFRRFFLLIYANLFKKMVFLSVFCCY